MTVKKIERLMNLLIMLLETPRPVSAREIREKVPGYNQSAEEAFKRMFERDKEELREMGIPLEKGPTDVWELETGYRVLKERYYLPEIDFEPDELAALWLAAQLLKLHDPGAARTALLKLGANVLGADSGSRLSWLAVDVGLSTPGLEEAFQAVADRKRVRFLYKTKEGQKKRTVDPYGITHRRGMWYLVGHDHRSGGIRSFRLDRFGSRIDQVDPGTPGPEYEIPEGFRPAAALEVPPFAQAEEQSLEARVRFSAKAAWLVERSEPWLILHRQEDGSVEADVKVSDWNGFVSWILWYGEDAEILSPDELRTAIRDRLEAICG